MKTLSFPEIHARVAAHYASEAANRAPYAVALAALTELRGALAQMGQAERGEVYADLVELVAEMNEPNDPEPEPRAAWEIVRDRWLAKGYNICSYHGFKPGPLPGCNAMYGDDLQCTASIDEHCHCGSGSHQAIADQGDRSWELTQDLTTVPF